MSSPARLTIPAGLGRPCSCTAEVTVAERSAGSASPAAHRIPATAASAYEVQVDVRLEPQPDVGERPHVVHGSQRQGGQPRRRENRRDGEQGALPERELPDLARARTAGPQDRRLDTAALGEEAREEEERRAGKHGELDGRHEHARPRDEQRPVGALEHPAQSGLHRQPGGGPAFGVQRVLERSEPLPQTAEVVQTDPRRVGLRAPARLGAVGGQRREGLARDDERPVGREAELLSPLDLERRAPPVGILDRRHAVHGGNADGNGLVLALDGGHLDHVTLSEAERLGGRLGERRVDLVPGCALRPFPGDELRVLLQPVERAEDDQRLLRDPAARRKRVGAGEAAAMDVDAVRAEDPLHGPGHLRVERRVVVGRHLARDGHGRVAHRRVFQGALQSARGDRLGVDRSRREQRRREEDGDERSSDDEQVVPGPTHDQGPRAERERAHARPRSLPDVPSALPPAESRPLTTSMAEPSTAS